MIRSTLFLIFLGMVGQIIAGDQSNAGNSCVVVFKPNRDFDQKARIYPAQLLKDGSVQILVMAGTLTLPVPLLENQSAAVTNNGTEQTMQPLDQGKAHRFNRSSKMWESFSVPLQSLCAVGIAFTCGLLLGFAIRAGNQ